MKWFGSGDEIFVVRDNFAGFQASPAISVPMDRDEGREIMSSGQVFAIEEGATIEAKKTLRPITVYTRDKSLEPMTGLFHGWAGLSERAIAIVEDADGKVHFFSSFTYEFQFLDRKD